MSEVTVQRPSAQNPCRCSGCKSAAAIGQPPEWSQPLVQLVEFEKANGKAHTLSRYHPLNFELLAPLNHDIPCVLGKVDVDWMFRVAMFSFDVVQAYSTYIAGKMLWNTVRGVGSMIDGSGQYPLEYGSLFDQANATAPALANLWLKPGVTLERLFAPALAMCDVPKKKI